VFIRKSGAFIIEYGETGSYGGIVTREYRIPVVIGVPSTTSVLKEDQCVTVNGEIGIIKIIYKGERR
jgi:pyruvate,water dikinase